MSKYSILINILDRIRNEAPAEMKSYLPAENEFEKINHARSKAYIHLFLKASLGILDFKERESYITDGSNDGGIDGYYIDTTSKSMFFIQSKFRTNELNFEKKEIELEEILKMDIDRIISGENAHENGEPYNSKILSMQRKMQSTPNIARYNYEVIILANLSSISDGKLKLLTSGLTTRVYDFKKTFSDLVFPIVCGTYYNYSDLCINVNLSNKSAGANINYSVETGLGMCDITVLFAPLNEIGKLMYEYKNSILKYNPRSYLTLKEGSINDEIRQTILKNETNEFALFNNGITILSDETFFNHRIGQKDKAQLSLKNPQIINGGQTAFTLSLIYEDSLKNDIALKDKLENKEVLIKIITFSLENEISLDKKLELIESISEATNKQNQVNNADRSSNNPLLIASQKSLFADFGFLLERKRGEFFDGLRYGYIEKSQVIDRGIFMRIAFACLGYAVPPKKEKQLLTEEKIDMVLNDTKSFKKYFFGCLLYSEFQNIANKNGIAQTLSLSAYPIISICSAKYYAENISDSDLKNLALKAIQDVSTDWAKFEDYFISQFHNSRSFIYNYNYSNKTYRLTSKFANYYRSQNLTVDINDYFFNSNVKLIEDDDLRLKKMTIEKYLSQRNLSIELINKIKPLIIPLKPFDEDNITSISQQVSLEIKYVREAIYLITSKDMGYYLADKEETLVLTKSNRY